MVLELDMEKNESRHKCYNLHRNYSKWIIDINVKHKTIKHLKDNIHDLGCGNNILDTMLKPCSIKERLK